MSQSAFSRAVHNVQQGIRVSGRLLSQIDSEEAQRIQSLYQTNSLLSAIYCAAHNTTHPSCGCGQPVRFVNIGKGFGRFCSTACSNDHLSEMNRLHNKQLNAQKSERLTDQYKQCMDRAVTMYLSGVSSVKEVAAICGVPHNRLRLALSEQGKIRTDVRSAKDRLRLRQRAPELFDSEFLKEAQHKKWTATKVAGELGVHPTTVCAHARLLEVPFPKTTIQAETDLQELIQPHFEVVMNTRSVISPLELDLWVPEKRVAVEHNGNYWHCEHSGKDKGYHLRKQLEAERANIRLIQLFEHEWKERRAQAESVVLAALGVFQDVIAARDTSCETIPNSVAKEFLDSHHLHGYARSSFSCGLFRGQELVCVATFARSRFSDKHDTELVRFAVKRHTRLIGGLGKCIAYYKKTVGFQSMVSYAHRRLFSGQSYVACGFQLSSKTRPGYFWINTKNGAVLSRYQTQKHKLPLADKIMTEVEFMHSQGFSRVWDCGQLVFTLSG